MLKLRHLQNLLILPAVFFFANCIVEKNQAETVSNQKFAFAENLNKSNENSANEKANVNENGEKTVTNADFNVNKTESSNSDSGAALTGNFRAAAIKNAELKTGMIWLFGKKNQQGWYLYTALIQHTLGTEAASDSEKFAGAVAVWQKKNNLPPNGIVDKMTFTELFKYWQSRRLKSLKEAEESFLLTAPSTDFFDPTRDAALLKVEKETYAAYKKMIAAAAADLKLKNKNGILSADEKFLKIISAYRSREYQESLRRKEPNAGRAQLAVVSPHFTGRALDLYVGGEPVTSRDDNRAVQVETPVYKWLVKNAERFGFYPYFYEPWHWEYVSEK